MPSNRWKDNPSRRENERESIMDLAQSTKNSNSTSLYFLGFLFIWWANFLFYPLWYLPAPDATRIAACCILFAVTALCSLTFRLLCHWKAPWGESPQEKREPAAFFAVLFAVAFAAHIPFLPWPILTGLDTIDHAAVPATIADRIVRDLSGLGGFSIKPLLPWMTVAFLAVLGWRASLRKWIAKVYEKFAQWADAHFILLFAIFAAATALYATFLLKWRPLDGFNDLNPLFRYPPLSKFFSIPLYTLFGLQEWTGRVMQIAFTFGGAVYLYRLTRLYGGVVSGQTAALLYVFLPPIFHYGNTTMIEGGSLFFIVAAFFHWIRFIEYKSQSDLLAGTLFATLACLYKHTGVSVIPAFAGMAAYDFLFPKENRTARFLIPSFLACAIPVVAIAAYMKLSSFNSDVPSNLHQPGLEIFLANLRALSEGITPFLAGLFLVGFLAAPFVAGLRAFFILACWIGAHYGLTCMSAAALNVRQALPYYIGLIVLSSLFVGRWTEERRWLRVGLVYCAAPVFLLWICLFMDRNVDYRIIGRAMGDRSYINFSNWNSMYLPYPQAFQALQELVQPGDNIYAPMSNEPSHFYLAKYPLQECMYHREFWTDASHRDLNSLFAYCREKNMNWLVLPRGRWLYERHADLSWLERLFTNPPAPFQPARVVQCGVEQIGIWKII